MLIRTLAGRKALVRKEVEGNLIEIDVRRVGLTRERKEKRK